jgi:multiple sugar transport system permease protein
VNGAGFQNSTFHHPEIRLRARRKKFDWGQATFILALLAPALLLYGLLVLSPMLQSFYVALHRWRGVSGNMTFVGMENFAVLAKDDKFRAALSHNLLFFLMAAVTILTLALFFANAVAQNLRGVELFRALFLFPNVVSIVAVSTLWMFLYNANWGLVNAVLRGIASWLASPAFVLLPLVVTLSALGALGFRIYTSHLRGAPLKNEIPPINITLAALTVIWAVLYAPRFGALPAIRQTVSEWSALTWLGNQKTVLPAVAATYVWYVLGFYILLFRAGIQNISADVNEAASIDGATGSQRFWFVTLPLLNEIVRLSVIYLIINSMNLFALVWVMAPPSGTGGATEMALTYLYQKGFVEQQFGYSTAIGAANFVIVMVITTVLQKVWRID